MTLGLADREANYTRQRKPEDLPQVRLTGRQKRRMRHKLRHGLRVSAREARRAGL